MRKQIRGVILIATFLNGLMGCSRGGFSEKTDAVVFGDSIAFGLGTSSPQYNLSSCLSKNTGFKFKNLGVNGDTSRGGLKRLNTVLSLKPKIVVLSLGGNDLLIDLATFSSFHRSFPPEETLANLESIFQELKNIGTTVYYINMSPPLTVQNLKSIPAYMDGRLSAIKFLAMKFPNVKFVENSMQGLWLQPKYMSDDIHPNDLGYAILCRRLYSQINHSGAF